MLAALLVVVAEAALPVADTVPDPVTPLAWTLLLLAEQVNDPLITPLFLLDWKGSQLKLPEDCALKDPLQSFKPGSEKLKMVRTMHQ